LSRKIFKASEVKEVGSRVIITPPKLYEKQIEEIEQVEEVEELKPKIEEVEVEKQIVSVQEEREKVLEEAKKVKEDAEISAKETIKEAEETAFKLMQKTNIEIRKLKEDAQKEADRIIEDAKKKTLEIENETNRKVDILIQEKKQKAINEGREEGFEKGYEEVNRLIERLHIILNTAIDKRQEIIDYSEKQLIGLVLLIVRKVVKVISESERRVVIENVKEALKKIKGETEIIIRVNTRDIDITTKHKKEFISLIEGLENISVEEDSRIDPGGCIIETSFGDVDARIQTQLQIIEDRIRELIPIKG